VWVATAGVGTLLNGAMQYSLPGQESSNRKGGDNSTIPSCLDISSARTLLSSVQNLAKFLAQTWEITMKVIARFEPQIFALLRIVTGFLFLAHGVQKVFGALGGNQVELISLMGLAGIIELVGGFLIMVGAFTAYAAFICSGLMAVAYFMAHAPRGFWPIVNKGELAALYSFLFLYLSVKGSGIWSVDAALKK
jgi:putative oxidoreductase